MSDNYENLTPVEENAVVNENYDMYNAEVELDLMDIEEETVNPELSMTTGQKVKVLLMKPLWSSIIKWVFIFLGIVGTVLYFIATGSRETGEQFAKIFGGFSGAVSSFFSLIPISMFEILICAAGVGILAYLVYIIVRTIQVKGGFHKGGLWVQFGYTLLAVAGVFAILASTCYGVFTYRERLSKNTDYSAAKVTNLELSETMLYLIDGLNNAYYEGKDNIFFTKKNLSKYQKSGDAIDAITEKVCEAFDAAAEDIETLKGPKVKTKELLFTPLYTSQQIASIYSPITGEVCINSDYPEVFAPMQIAKAIAIQRGYTDDGDADFIAFLVCTQYSDDYYINYSGYFNAYMQFSSQCYKSNGKDLHLYMANALHHRVKKEYVAVVKELDTLYGVSSDIDFVAALESLSGSDYCDVAKLLLVKFREQADDLNIDDTEAVSYGNYCNYLTNFYKIDSDFQDAVDEVYEEYHPED